MKVFLQDTVTLEKMVSGGYGLGRLTSGQIVFVKNTLPGEQVLLRYKESGKDFVFGRVLEYLKVSPLRISPICPLFGTCGGCQYQMLDYANQLSVKQDIIKDSLQRIGNLSADLLKSIVPSPKTFGYRNKGSFQVFEQGKIGFCKPGTTIPFEVSHCFLMEDPINEKIVDFSDYAERQKIKSFKSLNIRSNAEGKTIDSSKKRDAFVDKIGNLEFMIDVDTFFQVNRSIIPLWLEYIQSQLLRRLEKKGALLLDLFCGVGIIGQYLSPHFHKIIGIEVNKRLVENGKSVLQKNGISNMEFLVADASVYGELYPHPDAIILNPPRSGLHTNFMKSIEKFPPQFIVYSSCNPDTFARDVALLGNMGYSIQEMTPFDMFPQTTHTEIVTILEKN